MSLGQIKSNLIFMHIYYCLSNYFCLVYGSFLGWFTFRAAQDSPLSANHHIQLYIQNRTISYLISKTITTLFIEKSETAGVIHTTEERKLTFHLVSVKIPWTGNMLWLFLNNHNYCKCFANFKYNVHLLKTQKCHEIHYNLAKKDSHALTIKKILVRVLSSELLWS